MSITVIIPSNKQGKQLDQLIQNLTLFPQVSEIILAFDGIKAEQNWSSNVKILELPQCGKQQALLKAAKFVQSKWIWVLDDDVQLSKKSTQLPILNESDSVCFFGRMEFNNESVDSILTAIQYYETGVLNKINKWYWKKFNHLLWAYGGNLILSTQFFSQYSSPSYEKWKSGDDMFLLKYVIKNNISYQFLDSLVFTELKTSWKQSIQQRSRWAAKSGDISKTHLFIGSILVLYAVLVFLSLGLMASSYFWLILFLLPFVHLFFMPKPAKLSIWKLFCVPHAHLIHCLLVFFKAFLVSLNINSK